MFENLNIFMSYLGVNFFPIIKFKGYSLIYRFLFIDNIVFYVLHTMILFQIINYGKAIIKKSKILLQSKGTIASQPEENSLK